MLGRTAGARRRPARKTGNEVMSMDARTRAIMVSSLLLAGCGADLGMDGPSDGQGSSSGSGASASVGGTGAGAAPGVGGTAGVGSGSGTGSVPGVDPEVCVPGVPGTSQLPRLTGRQYDNTVRDLLDIKGDPAPSSMLAPDTLGSVDQRAWDGYQLAASELAATVIADAELKSNVVTCEPTGDGADCAREIITTFGRRAFRRPLTEPEVERFMKLHTERAAITENDTFDELAQLILEAFLLSPSFLMLSERTEVPEGELYVLDGYEVATRLSYMLWGSTPDETLLAAAAADELSTSEQILAQATRMLADERAHETVADFHADYLHFDVGTRWTDISRDEEIFPDFDPAMVPLFKQEMLRLVDHVVFTQGGTFQDLLTTPTGFVNATLAPLYDLDPADYTSPDLVEVDLTSARPGLLTRAGFLTSHALFNRTSPILRGAFIQKEVLCTVIAAPPPGVEGTPLPTDPSLTTNRARVDAQTSDGDCIQCHHGYINPTGFALESFDAIGKFQVAEHDGGAAIDTASTMFMGDEMPEVAVTGPVDMMSSIASSPAAQRCYAQKWVKFAYQRQVNSYDSCTVNQMAEKLTAGGYTVQNLISDLTQTQSFRYRALEAEVAP
jgi:hypothetical protein